MHNNCFISNLARHPLLHRPLCGGEHFRFPPTRFVILCSKKSNMAHASPCPLSPSQKIGETLHTEVSVDHPDPRTTAGCYMATRVQERDVIVSSQINPRQYFLNVITSGTALWLVRFDRRMTRFWCAYGQLPNLHREF